MNDKQMTKSSDMDSEKDHYFNPFAKPFFNTVIWVISFVFLTLLLYGMLTNWKHTPIFYVGFIFFSLGFLTFIKIGQGFFIQSYDIWVRDDKIETRGLYGQKWELKFDDIKAIVDPKGFISISGLEFHSFENPKLKIRINDATLKFGELAERIMENSPNIEKLELGELPDFVKLWKKEPDLELIERTKKRATENAKK